METFLEMDLFQVPPPKQLTELRNILLNIFNYVTDRDVKDPEYSDWFEEFQYTLDPFAKHMYYTALMFNEGRINMN